MQQLKNLANQQKLLNLSSFFLVVAACVEEHLLR